MGNRYDESAYQMCRSASSTGKITRTNVNLLARMFALLGDDTSETVRAIDGAIVNGTIEIVEDGDKVFKNQSRR